MRAKSELEPLLTEPSIREFFFCCLERTRTPLTPAAAATAAGVDVGHLATRLKLSGYPSPDKVMLWCRLLRAAWFLARMPGRSGDRIARALHFGSGQDLGGAFDRLTDMRPTEIRVRGGFTAVLQKLREEVGRSGTADNAHRRALTPFT